MTHLPTAILKTIYISMLLLRWDVTITDLTLLSILFTCNYSLCMVSWKGEGEFTWGSTGDLSDLTLLVWRTGGALGLPCSPSNTSVLWSAIHSLLVLGQRRRELRSDQLLCNRFSFLPCYHWWGGPEGCFPGCVPGIFFDPCPYFVQELPHWTCQCWGI